MSATKEVGTYDLANRLVGGVAKPIYGIGYRGDGEHTGVYAYTGAASPPEEPSAPVGILYVETEGS